MGSTKARNRRVTRQSPARPSIPQAVHDPDHFRSFFSQSVRFPNFGEPGTTSFQSVARGVIPIEMIIHRDPNGILRGIFSYFPEDIPPYEDAGNFLVFVDPGWQRQGIATELFELADKRFGIDLSNQRYTPDGKRFAEAMAKKRGYVIGRRFAADTKGATEEIFT